VTEPQQIILTVDRRGNIANHAQLPPEILAQLSTPEAQARIQAMYRDAHPKTGRRELRTTPEVKCEPRNFTAMKPLGMSSKEFRKLRRATLKSYTKQALKMQRAERNKRTA
jgi:hypothetical protein